MKRISTLIVFILILVSVAATPATAYDEYFGENVYRKNGYIYTIRDKGVSIIAYYGNESVVKVPSKIDGIQVYKIGMDYSEDKNILEKYDTTWDCGGFGGNEYVKKIIIPDGITDLGIEAFKNCKNLKTVVFGNGITKLTLEDFAYCVNLKNVELPLSLKKIGDGSFCYCKSLEQLKLPTSLKVIGDYAFKECKALKEIKIPSNVTKIKSGAFAYSGITKISVSKNNKNFSAKNGVLYNKKENDLIAFPKNKKISKFTIPSSVKKIMPYAFCGSNKLNRIIIPDMVTKIGASAFKDCKQLESISLSKKISHIGNNAFSDCKKLKRVIFSTKNKIKIAHYAFCNTSIKCVNIPANVVKISEKAFGYNIFNNKKGTHIEKIKGFVIKGKANSEAERYAKKYKFSFVRI